MFWLISLLIGLYLHPQVDASGVFEIKLLSFENKSGKDELGECCSRKLSSQKECQSDCRPRFRICLKEYQAKIDAMSPCTFGDVITSELGGSRDATNDDPQSGFVNPIVLRFPFTWPGTFSLIIEAWHGNQSDRSAVLVTRLMRQRWLDVGDGWTEDSHNAKYSTLKFEYRVTCEPHYYGKGCENLCRPRDDNFGHYSCSHTTGERVCLAGWTGDYCTKAQCLPGCDELHGHCSHPNECKCQSGWEGMLCDQCQRYPGCMHGSCVKPWDCLCDEGWGGLFCNQDLNFCTNHRPCRNGGTCFNTGQGSYTCRCPPEFNGTDCENIMETVVTQTPCNDGETCTENNAELSVCPNGSKKEHCQMPITNCSNFTCANGGKCLDTVKGLKCVCPKGFHGPTCSRNSLNICETNPCENDGKCIKTIDGFQCECPVGFIGDRCQTDADDCIDNNPCLNGGTCIDKVNEFRCQCIPGFVGHLCQNRVDYCITKPCANGGTCNQLINDYECQCPSGFGGKDCSSIEADQCLSNPCRNGGICIREVKLPYNYKCVCASGYQGSNCTELYTSIEASSSARVSTDSNLTTGHIIVIATMSTFIPIIALVAISAIICFKQRRKREKSQADEEARLQNEQNIANSNFIGKHNSALLMAATTLDSAAHIIKNRWDDKCTNNVTHHDVNRTNTPTPCDLEQMIPKEQQVIDGRSVYCRLSHNQSQQKQVNKEPCSATTASLNSGIITQRAASVLPSPSKLQQGSEYDPNKRLSVMSQSGQSSKDTPIFVIEDHYRGPINGGLFATEV